MKKKIIFLFTLITSLSATAQNITNEVEQRAKNLVKQMTLEEKIDYISGYNVFSIRAIPRLGIPEIKMADGPQGVRNDTQSTLYPSGILSAATWNKEMVYQLGIGLAQDAKARGIHIMLGPGVNIYRAPMCGRNFEYFGEDPYLTAQIAKQYILGLQSQKVMATIKHFAGNNQEWDRHYVSSDIDDRTLHEIYLPSFETAVKEANVGAVMNSYNLLNSVHASENKELNINILRKQWGFKGILMSDWVSVYSGVAAVNGGLDLEMPSGAYMNRENILSAIENGLIQEKTIDGKVQHILQTLIAFGFLDNTQLDTSIAKDNPHSRAAALSLAREGLVLLKNNSNALPLHGNGKVLLIGSNADIIPTGGGSGYVNPFSTVTIRQGLQQELKKNSLNFLPDKDIYYTKDGELTAPGNPASLFKAEYFRNKNLEGDAKVVYEDKIDHNWRNNAPLSNFPENNFSVRWTSVYTPQQSGIVRFRVSGDDGYRMFIDDKEVLEYWSDHAVTSREYYTTVEAGKKYQLRIEYFDSEGDASASFSAEYINEELIKNELKKVDNVVISAGFNSETESEGYDRPFGLPKGQEGLIKLIAANHNNVIVVVNAGGGINFTPWIDDVKAVLMAWYPGQEGGKAIAEVLTGKISPSGKLPISIGKRWEDNPVHNSYYDHRNVVNKRVQYDEGVFVGYRGYERNQIAPLFPFGYGLSYSSFTYSNLTVEKVDVDKVKVSFDVKNTGKVDASEVAQIYVKDIEASVPRPQKELKGFEKTFLKKGETKTLTVILDKRAFSFYDVDKRDFVVESGQFDILVGPSSVDLPLSKTIDL